MGKISWDDAQPHFEDMVSVLLSTLNPEAERIDGSGGDGGRDVQIRHPDHTDLFELKSFTGRLSREKGRRPQVERSLARAAQHEPASWTLVVPIDHTEGELQWFNSLREQYDFPLVWCGKTWLERELAHHPQIARFYLEGAAEEAMRLLRELHQEEAGLDHGASDAVERLRRLRDRIEEIDPHYRLDIHLTGDTTEIALRPRYRGAEIDSPIVIRGNLTFPDTELGQEVLEKYRNVFDYGDSVEIPPEFIHDMHVDAPAGLGGDLTGGHLIIGPTATEEYEVNGRLVVLSPDRQPLASLPIRFTERRAGLLGGTFTGRDLTGSVTVTVRLDWSNKTGNITFQLKPPSGLLPGPLLSVLRAAHALRGPNLAHLHIDGVTLGQPIVLPDQAPLITAELVALISDLERLQTATGTPFAVPDQLTHRDQVNIRRGLRLLDGEPIEMQTETITTPLSSPSESLIDYLRHDEARAFAADSPQMDLPVAGVRIPLGPTRCYIAAARIENREELLGAHPWPPDKPITLILRPEPGQRMQLRRLPPPDQSTEQLWIRGT